MVFSDSALALFRKDDAWIADVVDVDGAHTYARNLTALEEAVHEVIALVEDRPDDAARSPLRFVYRNVDDEFLAAAKLGDEREELETKQRQLAVATAITAVNLARSGHSVRDISGALRMSPGRVSQIVSAARSSKGSDVV